MTFHMMFFVPSLFLLYHSLSYHHLKESSALSQPEQNLSSVSTLSTFLFVCFLFFCCCCSRLVMCRIRWSQWCKFLPCHAQENNHATRFTPTVLCCCHDQVQVQRSSGRWNKQLSIMATEGHVVGYVTLGEKSRNHSVMPDFVCRGREASLTSDLWSVITPHYTR